MPSARPPRRRFRRLLVVLATTLALLFQGAFAAACGLHDLGHDAGSVQIAADHAADGGEDDGFDWHGLFHAFHAGHGCLHMFGPACVPAADLFVANASRPPVPAVNARPPAPPGVLLRPPIDA